MERHNTGSALVPRGGFLTTMGGVIGMLSMELQRQGMNGLPGMQMGLVNAMRTGTQSAEPETLAFFRSGHPELDSSAPTLGR